MKSLVRDVSIKIKWIMCNKYVEYVNKQSIFTLIKERGI